MILLPSGEWTVRRLSSSKASEQEKVFEGLSPIWCCPEKWSRKNRISHPDWVKICVDPNGQIKWTKIRSSFCYNREHFHHCWRIQKCWYVSTNTHFSYFSVYFLYKSVKLATVVEGDQKGYYTEVLGRALLLSLDCSTLSLICTLYCWVLTKEVSSTILNSLLWRDLGLNPGFQDHWWTLYPLGQWAGLYFLYTHTQMLYVYNFFEKHLNSSALTKRYLKTYIKPFVRIEI